MREPNPDRMMERMSARQFNTWRAFELAFGPIDGTWDREMIAQQHELLQLNNQLTGASITKKGGKNPAGKFRRVPRPWALYEPDHDDVNEDEDETEETEAQAIARFDAEVFGPSKTE